MNRLTAIGLASLVAYGVLVASKYAGVVSLAHEREPTRIAQDEAASQDSALVVTPPRAQPRMSLVPMPTPLPRMEPTRASAIAVEFRSTRDLRSFTDSLEARRASLTADE